MQRIRANTDNSSWSARRICPKRIFSTGKERFLKYIGIRIGLVFVLAIVLGQSSRVYGQAAEIEWDQPVVLYQSPNLVDPPLLLSDQGGRLHLFWNERELEPQQGDISSAIFYMRYENNIWTKPVDIIAPGGLDLAGIVDEYGIIHLVYGDLDKPSYYIQAVSSNPVSALDFAEPMRLDSGAQQAANIFVEGSNIEIIFTKANGTINSIQSSDYGLTWSAPEEVSPNLPFGEAGKSGSLEVAADERGRRYVAWTRVPVPDNYPPTGAEIVAETADQERWSLPEEIVGADYEINALTAAGDGHLHVLSVGRVGVGGRYYYESADGGSTWSEPITLSEPELGTGLSGGDLALDSAGNIHAVFGLDIRESQNTDTTITHSMRISGWTPLRDISDASDGHKENMQIEIINGNEAHVVWQIVGRNFDMPNGIGYVRGTLDIPSLEPIAFAPPVEPSISVNTTAPRSVSADGGVNRNEVAGTSDNASAQSTITASFDRSTPESRSGLVNSPQAAIMASVGLVAGLVGLVLLGRLARRRR